MADQRYMSDYPQHHRTEERRTASGSHPYPPAPDESQRHPEGAPSTMAASVSLPSIHDPRVSSYGQPPPQQPPSARGYSDPRYASPSTANGYPPPPGQQPPSHQGQGYLPPLQQQPDSRSPGYPPPPDQRGGYYDDRRPPYQHDQYGPESYYYRGPPGQGPPPNGYPRDYRGPPPGAYAEYAQAPGTGPPMAQAAPRQRTSIACRYCRKRKIRCSGYQSAPGGKCQNCARMNQECIFQPVSSSSSAAFIPVSAVPGGVPPGTQLFGAYGQPLNPAAVPGHPQPYGGQPPPPGSYYQQPAHSPAETFSSYGDPRVEDVHGGGRRRRRTPEEHEEGYRLPPPRMSEDDPRRRSPAEFSNNSSPTGVSYPPYPGSTQSPRNPGQQSTSAAGPGGRSPVAQSGSSGASTPARSGTQATSQGQQGTSSVMSLSNLVDIDRGMIDRLNRPRDGGPGQGGR